MSNARGAMPAYTNVKISRFVTITNDGIYHVGVWVQHREKSLNIAYCVNTGKFLRRGMPRYVTSQVIEQLKMNLDNNLIVPIEASNNQSSTSPKTTVKRYNPDDLKALLGVLATARDYTDIRTDVFICVTKEHCYANVVLRYIKVPYAHRFCIDTGEFVDIVPSVPKYVTNQVVVQLQAYLADNLIIPYEIVGDGVRSFKDLKHYNYHNLTEYLVRHGRDTHE